MRGCRRTSRQAVWSSLSSDECSVHRSAASLSPDPSLPRKATQTSRSSWLQAHREGPRLPGRGFQERQRIRDDNKEVCECRSMRGRVQGGTAVESDIIRRFKRLCKRWGLERHTQVVQGNEIGGKRSEIGSNTHLSHRCGPMSLSPSPGRQGRHSDWAYFSFSGTPLGNKMLSPYYFLPAACLIGWGRLRNMDKCLAAAPSLPYPLLQEQ